ncbi:MAG: hypothetical protein ABJC63_05820 [Gemmatimonadales bacterium]
MNSIHRSINQSRLMALVAAASIGIFACSKSDAPASGGAEGGAANGEASTSAASAGNVPTQPPNADPCMWMSQAEAEAVLGKLDRAPARNHGDEAIKPDPNGKMCAYVVQALKPTSIPSGVYVEVASHDGTQLTAGVMAGLRAVTDWFPEGYAAKDTGTAGPWDQAAGFGKRLFTARQGDAAVLLTGIGYGIPKEQLGAIAAKVLAKIPDMPTAAPPPRSDGDNENPPGDPCSFVTVADAEKVLGKLAVAPYRSRSTTSMAWDNGGSCSYRTPKHRVLVLTPTWEGGKNELKMAAITSQQTSKILGGSAEGDTLEGPWDQVAGGPSGEVYFLKGDKLIAIQYNTSSTGIAGAVALARIALGKF